MTYDERTGRTLRTVDARLAEKLGRVLAAMAVLGHPMVAYEGLRSLTRQQELYAQGRTTTGPKVTNCDGVIKVSRHQQGRAVDCAFVVGGETSDDWRIRWTGPWDAYGACAEAVGLNWGGHFTAINDRPHVELKETEP